MTIGTSARVSVNCDGITKVFPIAIQAYQATDITVIHTTAAGNEAALILNSDYSLSATGTLAPPAQTLTTLAATAFPAGDTLQAFINPVQSQQTQYVQGQQFPSLAVQTNMDRLTQMVQRLQDQVSRALIAPDGDLSPVMTLVPAASRAGLTQMYDSFGNATVGTPVTGTITGALIAALLNVITTTAPIGDRIRTAAEIAAGVTPTNFAYIPGDVRRYGAVGNGSTDDAAAFANAALVSGTHPLIIPYTATGYKVNTPFVLPVNGTMLGLGRPTLFSTLLAASGANAGTILSATTVATITIDGVLFRGASSASIPNAGGGFGGYSATSMGLVTITNCTDVRITNCEFSTFYNGLSTINCTRLWINKTRVQHWLFAGIIASASSEFMIDDNDVRGCDQAGASVAYGITATGDQAGTGGHGSIIQARNSISFNRIADIPSWAGIMTHDCDGLEIIGNDIRNVRKGLDIGHLVGTNFVRNLVLEGNYIEATTTDTYAGAPAEHGGILVEGVDNGTGPITGITQANPCVVTISQNWNIGDLVTITGVVGMTQINTQTAAITARTGTTITLGSINSTAYTAYVSGGTASDSGRRVQRVTIANNILVGFFNMPGMTGGGNPNTITVLNADRLTLTGNVLDGIGNSFPNAGIFLNGVIQGGCTITGNVVNGNTVSGSFRLAGVTADAIAVHGNSWQQLNPVNAAFISTGSTVAAWAYYGNPTNAVSPVNVSTSTLTFSGYDSSRIRTVVPYSVSMTFDASLGNEFDITATNTVAFSIQNPSNPSDGQRITVTVRNTSGGVIPAIGWGAAFKMVAFTNPATGFSRSYDFRYDGTRQAWDQVCQTNGDVPN